MEIKVLGPGCASCQKLEKIVEEAVKELKLTSPVIKVSDMKEIMTFGVMSLPALVIDGNVKFSGRVPSKDEIKKYLQGASGSDSCSCGSGCCK
ncbi:MAG TPA: thioredoxin family protein [Bacillota bacterium]|nr:thioredoxin family protein [Bacillota bacterium]